jgi:glycerophosphoryl diester phosphodiesterase
MIARLVLAILSIMSVSDAASRILVHGHRGARAVRPENTLPAFEYAIQAGVDVLELDIAVTKDNVLVVSHDPTLLPTICTGPKPDAVIRELTLQELRQYDCGALKNPGFPKQQPVPGTRVPTLDEVLTMAAPSKVEFNIETKIFRDKPQYTPAPEEFSRMLLAEIRKHHLESRVIVQSFDFRTLHAMKKLAPEIRLSALYIGLPKDFVALAQESGAQIVSPYYLLVTKDRVAAAHKAGLQVVPWTANTPKDWDKLIDAKVDAIISDDPAELIAYLKSLGGSD